MSCWTWQVLVFFSRKETYFSGKETLFSRKQVLNLRGCRFLFAKRNSLFEKRNARARERDRGVERVWQGGVKSVRATFRPLGILSRIRGNSATNPWWPLADKHTAVKRYDILSLRELRRGSRGNVLARHEESVSTNDTLENHCAMSRALLFGTITRVKLFVISTRTRIRVLSSILHSTTQ